MKQRVGVFKVVESIGPLGEGWKYNSDESFGRLTLGKDIDEMPLHGLALLVEYPHKDKPEIQAGFVIESLRKFARAAWCDYVSAEVFGGQYFSQFICTRGDLALTEVRPRAFRKIH